MNIKRIGIPGALIAGLALTAEPVLHEKENCGGASICQSRDFVGPAQEHTHEQYSTRHAGENNMAVVSSSSSAVDIVAL